VPLLALHLPKSRTETIMRALQSGNGERNGAQRRTKVGFGKTMIQALELLGIKIKPIELAIIEVCLSEGISK